MPADECFNSPARTCLLSLPCLTRAFQFTRPYGQEPGCLWCSIPSQCFNSPARMGRNLEPAKYFTLGKSVSTHLPAWTGTCVCGSCHYCFCLVSIHPPAWAGTGIIWSEILDFIVSTHLPVKARTTAIIEY